MKDIIQKAHNVGDEKVYQGITYYVASLNSSGKPLWRKKKGENKTKENHDVTENKESEDEGSKQLSDFTPDEVVKYANETKTDNLVNAVNDKNNSKDLRQLIFNVLKKREDYDKDKVKSEDLPNGYIKAPESKIKYSNGPEVKISVPDSRFKKINGRPVRVSTSEERRKYSKMSDDDLIKFINNNKANALDRHLAFQEASSRGIKEDKLDFNGTLKDLWDREKQKQDALKYANEINNPEEAEDYDIDLKGFDMDSFMDKFKGGDVGWLDKRNPIVQKSFNFDTLVGRQQYDAVKDFQQRQLAGYLTPTNKIGELNQQYEDFVNKDTTPLFISSGGAGAGKSYGLWAVLNDSDIPKLEEGDDPSEGNDYGWVQCDDPDDEEDFRRMLSKYNGTYTDDNGDDHGHILVFDDADKILTTRSAAMDKTLKKICDNNEKSRTFVNPDTGNTEVWKGRIIVLTNKDVDNIAEKNEDKKAVLSRGIVNNINFTRNETIEILANRYKTMGLSSYQKAFNKDFPDKKDQQKIRKMAYDFMKDNVNEADPAKFTPRSFIQVMQAIGPSIKNGGKTKMIHGTVQIGTNLPWQVKAMNIIKSINFNEMEDIIEKAITAEDMVKTKEDLEKRKKEMKKKNPKLYSKLYGEEAIDSFISGDSEDKKSSKDSKKNNKLLKKAQDYLFGDNIEKAEFSEKERKSLSKKKEALPDGSFPIRNISDLQNAIKSIGRAKDPERAKRWIKKRAKELKSEKILPETWKAENTDLEKAENYLFGK